MEKNDNEIRGLEAGVMEGHDLCAMSQQTQTMTFSDLSEF